MRTALLLSAACAVVSTQAAIWTFDLGPAVNGFGLNGQNVFPEPPIVSSATGGIDDEVGAITFDDETRQLMLNVAWGDVEVVNGTPLSSAPSAFTLNLGPVGESGIEIAELPLAGFSTGDDPSGRSGYYNAIVTLTEADAAQINSGNFFFQIETVNYPNGEIRGQLTPVPEPEHYAAFAGLALLGFAGYRRYRTARAA